MHRIEERATAVPYASYEKTAFLNRLEYLANHASETYEKIMGNIGNTVRLASALVAVLTYLATLDPVLFVVAIAPFLLTMVLRRQGAVRHDYEVEKVSTTGKRRMCGANFSSTKIWRSCALRMPTAFWII